MKYGSKKYYLRQKSYSNKHYKVWLKQFNKELKQAYKDQEQGRVTNV